MKSNPDNSPNIFPTPIDPLIPVLPAKPAEFPDEAKKLDGVPLGAVTPGDNNAAVDGAVGQPSKEGPAVAPAESTDFMLHPDGALMKYVPAPRVPQQFLVDGQGRQFGVARNEAVAELLCNAVNSMHLAAMKIRAEDDAKQSAAGGQPPAIFTPPGVSLN